MSYCFAINACYYLFLHAMRMPLLAVAIMRIRCFKYLPVLLVVVCGSVQAGEWMFRLKDAHVQLRKALSDKDADAAWEQVSRQTRQEAGLLAARIRDRFDDLTETQQQALRAHFGMQDDEQIRKMEGKHLLVAPCFLEAHPYLLAGNRDDVRLKDHGTRMAGPTAIVVHKKTPEEKLVEYTFTVEPHFGGQAMDYRAELSMPALDAILGPAPERAVLSPEEAAGQAVAVFRRARQAFAAQDFDALWPLLDCDSQSQASHFADQAKEQAQKKKDPAGIAQRLGITVDELAALDGKRVWALPWTREDLAFLADARDPKYVPASGFNAKYLPLPEGAKSKRGKRLPAEPVVEFESAGRTWQIPARLNYRNGNPEIKLYLRPPFYLRLRDRRGRGK